MARQMKQLLTARTAILGTLLFATAMTALSEGGWWWAILAVAVLWRTEVRLPFLHRFGLPSTHRYILASWSGPVQLLTGLVTGSDRPRPVLWTREIPPNGKDMEMDVHHVVTAAAGVGTKEKLS
jgi:hypothetical protein